MSDTFLKPRTALFDPLCKSCSLFSYLWQQLIHLTTLITSPIDFLLYFQNCSRYWYEIFRKVWTIYMSGFSNKIMRIDSCVFALQVLEHNNPHFQKLQSLADLRPHCFSDKFIIYCNKTTSIPFSCIKIRILNLIIKIKAKIPWDL